MHYGLEGRIIAVTDYCQLPFKSGTTKRIGGVKDPDIEKIISLKPDLVFVNVEENTKKDALALSEHMPVFVTYVSSIDDVKRFLKNIGLIFDKQTISDSIINKIDTIVVEVKKTAYRFSFVYFVWKDPYIVCNSDTYISRLIETKGGVNIFTNKRNHSNYFEVSINEVKENSPDLIFLPNEPYEFDESDGNLLYNKLGGKVQKKKIINANGYLINWWGIKTPKALRYISNIVDTALM